MSAGTFNAWSIAATVRLQPFVPYGLLIGGLLLVLIGMLAGLLLALGPAAPEPQLLAPFRWGPAPTRQIG